MRQLQSTILYLYLILIIVTGVALFIFKDAAVDKFLNYSINGSVVSVTPRTNQEFKLDILRDSRVKALKNYVSVFNYNDLDKSQEAILANANKSGDVIISNPDATATSTANNTKQLIRVRVGNSNPFLVTKETK